MDTLQQALEKLKHYCGYQERCHQEAADKLRSLGIWGDDADEILATLITEGFLNEERFARSFAGGKFRMKRWGRRKIADALKRRKISPYCITKGLEEIPEADYREALEKLAEDKYHSLRKDQYRVREYKTTRFLLARGYEPALVSETLRKVTG